MPAAGTAPAAPYLLRLLSASVTKDTKPSPPALLGSDFCDRKDREP
jgi:hypothetical protein